MVHIESKDNNLFKETKKLKERKGRNKSSKYLIEGFRLIEEACKANLPIEYIFISHRLEENKFEEYLGKYITNSMKLYTLKDSLLRELCSTEEPQGVVAVVRMNEVDLNKEGSFYILCDKVQDPGNLGTIIRTAHAAGVDGVILTKGTVDIYNEKTIRSTMGSMFYIPIILEDSDFTITKSLINKGFSLLATSLEGNKDFFKEDLSGKIIISVGNEGNGVSEEVYSLSDKKVKIPMPGGAESLNVAIATSIVIYEKVRQNQLNF
ncbi:RNA methyltransferase [Clostridium paraputrificum]|uniref:TrmH family RNA methyltransferase n=1 Tax=Clostridium paraputrificum TaxID=29363 RepID=UPI000D810A7E|nr:RNA methyltransferase [Clostridium paraputrificum]RKI46669.1 RNA methyltransferase [Clostridium paraputrificum]SQB91365.1 tRNA/rRNA methyltransferase [Clostridium paraputrificum]